MTAVRVAAAQSGAPGVASCSSALQSLAPSHCSEHILQRPVLSLINLTAPEGAVDMNPVAEAQRDESPSYIDTVIILIMVPISRCSTQDTFASVTWLVITIIVVKKYFLHIKLGR